MPSPVKLPMGGFTTFRAYPRPNAKVHRIPLTNRPDPVIMVPRRTHLAFSSRQVSSSSHDCSRSCTATFHPYKGLTERTVRDWIATTTIAVVCLVAPLKNDQLLFLVLAHSLGYVWRLPPRLPLKELENQMQRTLHQAVLMITGKPQRNKLLLCCFPFHHTALLTSKCRQ